MPDPTEVSPVALAEKAQLITPDDATYLNGVMDRTGVNVDLVGQDLTQVRRQWDTIEKGKSFSSLTDDPLAAAWLVKAHNAAAVQDDLQSIIGFRDALKGSTLPQPASMFELSGAYLSKSWKMAYIGTGIVATTPISLVQAAMGEDTVAGLLADAGGEVDKQYRAQRTGIVDRLLSTGGNEYQVLVGELLGQAPEMVGSGGLAALGAKSLAKPLIKMLGMSMLSETKVALTGMSVIEGMQGAAMNLSARAADNADAGKDPVSMHDVAASLSIGAMTALVARVAGLTGEARLLGGGRVSTWAGVGRDVAIQMGEETSQEVFEQLINDIADKRFSGWESYKWAALGGAIGGGMFSAPAFIQKMRSTAPPAQRDAAARDIRVLSDIAQAPVATANAHALAQQQAILAQSKAIKRGLSLDDLSQLTGASRTDKQFFDAGDFAKVAEAFSMAPERLIAEWGGKSEGGTVEVNTVAMAYGMRQAKPEQVAAAIEHARKQPDKPSLADIQVRMKEIEAIAAEDDEAALPGGVKDDSDAIAKEVEAEVAAAQVDTKRTKANARADAQLEAARWRSAAVTWNAAYASKGDTKRVTPKQLYDKSKAKISGESDQVLTPEEIDRMLSELGEAVAKGATPAQQPAGQPTQVAKPTAATGGGWNAVQKLADAYKVSATAENLAAVKAAIIAEAKAGTLTAPNGSKVTHVFETDQGSIYVITEDGQTRRVKSEHKNTGDDHGLKDWEKHGIFVTDSNLVQLRSDADPNNRKTHAAVSVQDMMRKFGGHGTALTFKDGKARVKIYTDGAWRDAKWSDMFPKSIGTLVQDGVIEFSYSKSPVDGGGILEWEARDNGTLRGVHPGSPVLPGSIVDIKSDSTLAQPAYHGTANSHQYDRMDYQKVGGAGGEGNQAYGWGLYFTSMKEVADVYRGQLSARTAKIADAWAWVKELRSKSPFEWNGDVFDHEFGGESLQDAVASKDSSAIAAAFDGPIEDVTKWVEANAKWPKASGKLYTVDIPEDSDMMDWDTEVPAAIIKKIDPAILDSINDTLAERNMGAIEDGGYTGKELYKLLAKHSEALPNSDADNDQKAASDYLLSIGVPGIKYLGEAKKAGKPITNYVIFDDSKVKITELEQKDRATYDPTKLAVKLNKASDASSVQHELAHHWLNTLSAWAADPSAPDAFREQAQAIGTWATDNAESIAKHYTATTDKGVSADAIRTAAADMANLNLNTAAGKAIHEGFTGAYEQYLATGKAPTTALKRVFASFRRWMRDVARSMFSADLLTDDAKAIFDRMLMSHDQVAQPHLQQLTAESLGMSDEQFGLMEDVREDAIRKSQVEIERILDRRARAYAKQDEVALRENVKSLVDAKPENRARAILAKQRISKAAAHAVIKDPAKQAAIEQFVADAGLDPQEVANSAGYSTEAGSIEMLESLADGKSYDQVLSEAVMEAKTAMPPLTVEDRIEELRVSAEGRALMAAAEGAAMRDAIRLSKAGKAEGVKAGAAEATAQAEVDATAAEAVSEERVNAMKASRDAWQTKAKDAAVRLKATKAAWDVEGARIIAEMEQENAALINDGAAYRLMQKTHKQSDLQQEHDANVKKMAKAVKNRDYRLAINTHLEILTLSKMRSMLAAKTVQDVKADAASRKKATLDALSAGAAYDAALMAEMAHDKVRRIPATDLREGVWGKRADAARRRREKAVAQQNIPAILKSTNEIMWAETMEAEVLRTLAEKDAIATGVANSLSATERVKLVYAGAPTIVYYEGDAVVKTETFPTWTAAEQRHANIRGYAIGAVLTRGGELSNVRDAVDALMSRKRRNDGIAALQAIVDGKVTGITYMTARMKGLVDEHAHAQPQPAGGGRLNPDLWTLHDWETVMEQMETLQSAAAIVPRQREEQEAVLHEMFNAVDIKAKPPTQRSKMSGPIRALSGFSSSGLNIRSLGVKLGSAFEKHIMQPLLAAEAEGFALRRRIGKMVQGHIDGITGPLRKQMDQRYDSYGVKTDGWERISRLLMLGTRTGRDRVVNDLKLRGCTDVSAFLQDMSKGLSQQEVDLIGAWWKANEEIWRFQQASAVRTGQTPPKSLEATPFDVLVDGKPMRLAGGYAAVPYEISKSAPRIMDDDGRMVMAFFDDGFMNERVEKVDSKLDLSIEAQFNSQISKIRTAALKPHAFNVSAILTDSRFREQSISHYGEDWYKALVSDVKFAFNGDANAKDALNSAASYVRRAFTFSVYWMNMKTAISQFSGIVNSAAHPDIGFRALLGSMGNALHGPKAFSERIAQSSYVTLMRTHAQDADYMSPDEVTQSARTYEKWLSAGTWAMRKAQWIVDTVTWDAAYQKAKANLRNKVTDSVELEYRAVAIANRALHETQGSAMRAEQSAISHSEIGRLVTFGGKWMLNYGNYLRRQMHAAFAEMKVGDSWEARKAFAKSVLVGLVMNAMAYQAVRALVSPEKDDDEQRDMTDYAWAVGTDVAGTPNHVIRMFAIPAFEAFVSNTKTLQQQRGGLIQLSGERSMEDAVSLFKNFGYILRGEDKGDSPQRMIGQAVSAGSIILPGLPGTMTKRLMDADFDQGYEAWVAAVFGWDKTPIRQDAN